MSLSGAVVVTTPQELAVVDVLKGLRMWQVIKVLHAARHIIDGREGASKKRELLLDFFRDLLDFFSPFPCLTVASRSPRLSMHHDCSGVMGARQHLHGMSCAVGMCLSPCLVVFRCRR